MNDQKYLLFVVEDDPVQAEIIKWELEQNPLYAVAHFLSGEDMLQALDQNPDIILLDYHLNSENPRALNAFEIAQQLEGYTYMIHSKESDLRKALPLIEQGACDYVVKDERSFLEIRKRVDETLSHQTKKREIESLAIEKNKDLSRLAMVLGATMVVVLSAILLT